MYNSEIPNDELCWHISHEHLHLLQTYFEQQLHQSDKKVDCSNPQKIGLLKEAAKQGKTGAYIDYLFLRHETEARLHELVLTYYREYKQLPVSLNGFLKMLLNFECFSNSIQKKHPDLYRELPHEGIETIGYRSEHIMADLELIVMSFKDTDSLRAYLYEALPKMYSNLLSYYGDLNSSKIMSASIPSTDLYEAMYSSDS